MIGNSLKSDILPVLAIGGHAVHIPFIPLATKKLIEIVHENFRTYEKISRFNRLLKNVFLLKTWF
jgi:putative hydrolase of the HAD superfamily